MAFFQDPPELSNQYKSDALFQEYVRRKLPEEIRSELEPIYSRLGELAAGELYRFQLQDRLKEPVHTQWDAWGQRIDHIELTPLWQRARAITAEFGLVAAGYANKYGAYDRVHQFLMNYAVQASLDVYSCPLAMTDGAAKTLLSSENRALIDHALPRLTHSDPDQMWTSGQWMTERTGGSDVSQTETVARKVGDEWCLYGTKWFTSATTSEMALALARPEGNPEGSRGLALFYVELHDEAGRLKGIHINRLKDKFGTRKVPTAELTLDGVPAIPVKGLEQGVREITPMLNITRAWNALGAASGMRRAVALAQDYAQRRRVFGQLLIDQPLHVVTLGNIAAIAQGAFLLMLRSVEILGRIEAGVASESEELLLRVITPIAKLTTGKQAVVVASEAMESFGGAGYVEDTGLPRLLADAQVLPIWEGTTNVLSLDTLRALAQPGVADALWAEFERSLSTIEHDQFTDKVAKIRAVLSGAQQWYQEHVHERALFEAGARHFAMQIGLALEEALLLEHVQWCETQGDGARAARAVEYFSGASVPLALPL